MNHIFRVGLLNNIGVHQSVKNSNPNTRLIEATVGIAKKTKKTITLKILKSKPQVGAHLRPNLLFEGLRLPKTLDLHRPPPTNKYCHVGNRVIFSSVPEVLH